MASLINGLLFECPFKQELENCPFSELRSHGFSGAINKLAAYDASTINQLNLYHRLCSKTREMSFRNIHV